MIKARSRSDGGVRLLARCFLLLVGVLVYHQCGQSKQYLEKLRTACAAKGGKLTLSNLCINMKPMLDEMAGALSFAAPYRRDGLFGGTPSPSPLSNPGHLFLAPMAVKQRGNQMVTPQATLIAQGEEC